MINERLKKQIEFMIEVDKLKNIYRQTYVLNEDRKENDAEHSWHLALLTFLLAEYANEDFDVLKAMKMVLIHDIVEIDAGDTYCYDTEGYKTKSIREENAARRIFGLLPDDQNKEFYSLWREFEDCESAESKFAAVLDRIQPLTLNFHKGGISWKEHNVSKQQVIDRNCHTAEGSSALWDYALNIINEATELGLLKK